MSKELEDPNIPVKDWEEYIKLVEEGKLEQPKEIKVKKRPDYYFNVDQALDNIDLTFNGYTPSKDAIEFFNVIRLVLGSEPEVPNSLAHYFLVDLVFNNIKREQYPYTKEIRDRIRLNERKIAIIAARGVSKSTIITTYLPVYLAIKGDMPNFGRVAFVVAFGDSQLGGAKVIAQSVRALCEDSDFCKEYFEKMRFTDDECEFVRRGRGKVKNRSFMYKTKGASSGVRGIRYRGERPSMLLMDDIIKNEADASSKIIMSKLRSMIFADAENALSGHKGKIIAINTPFNKSDPIYSALESGVWTPICLPICEKMDLDLKKKDYVGVWPQMHPYERIKERYEDAYYGGTLREFNQELMLRISSDEDKLIKDDMIQWYDRSRIIKNLGNFTLLATTDFTASNSKNGDYSGIAMWAIGADDDKFLLDLELKKRSIQDQYDALFRMISKWGRGGRLIEVGIETDGQQRLNLFALKKMMIEKNIWFRFAKQKGASASSEGITSRVSGGNKLERFKYMMPSFEQKKIWFPNELKDTADMKEMLEELKYVTHSSINSKHDDACFVAGTQIRMADGGYKNIEDIVAGDLVMTFGSDDLTTLAKNVIMTPLQEVVEYTFNDKSTVTCTPNHRVLTYSGWKAIDDILSNEAIITIKDSICKLSTMGIDGVEKRQDTTNQLRILMENVNGYISTSGINLMENNLKGIISIIKTGIKTITTSKIWNLFQHRNTHYYMDKNGQRKENKKLESTYTKSGIKQQNGIDQKKVEHGTDNKDKKLKIASLKKIKNASVLGAVNQLCHILKTKTYIVIENVNFNIYKLIKKIKNVSVQNVVRYSTGIERNSHVQKNVKMTETKDFIKNDSKSFHVKNVERSILETLLKQMGFVVNSVKEKQKLKIKTLWQIEDVKNVENYIHLNEVLVNSVAMNVEERTIIAKKRKGKQNVYNFEAEETHNYIIGNGSVVHNCDLISQIGMIEYLQPTNGIDLDADERLSDANADIWGNWEDEEENTSSVIF